MIWAWQRKTLRGRSTDVITDKRTLSAGDDLRVFGETGVECADGVAVRVGVAEEDFEGTARHKDEFGRMKDEFRAGEF
jgi:hypothetical protein